MRDLASPGAALAARARLQNTLTAALTAATRLFLADAYAMATGQPLPGLPALTAAARPVMPPVLPPLATMVDRWERIVLDQLAPGGDPIVPAGVARTIGGTPVPSIVADRLRDILVADLTPPERLAALDDALDLHHFTGDGGDTVWKALQPAIAEQARTAATTAFNEVALEQLYVQGYPDKRWVAHHDAHTRDTHRAADGQTVTLAEPFIVGGYALAVPGDQTAPAEEAINCRCTVVGAGTRRRV